MHIRLAAATLAVLLTPGCLDGSSPPTLERFVRARHVAAELAIAHPGAGVSLVAESGDLAVVVKLPESLEGPDSPSWSPDGSRIVFTADTGAPSRGPLLPPTDVYVASVPGGAIRRVTTGRNALYPEWSPDGRWIAYSAVAKADAGRTAAIWIVHPDGTGATRLTHPADGAYDFAGPYNPRTGRSSPSGPPTAAGSCSLRPATTPPVSASVRTSRAGSGSSR